jgi:hypothetical protein
MVLYAGWPTTPSPDMVRSVTDLAETLRELVTDTVPGGQTVAAVTVEVDPDGAPHDAEDVRRALVGPAAVGTVGAALPYDGDPAGLWIDCGGRRVTIAGREIPLTRREFDLLAFLARHPRRVFSRPELLRHVWHDGNNPSSRTVDVHIRRLRAKLGREEHRLTTVRGVGYRYETGRRPRSPQLATGRI